MDASKPFNTGMDKIEDDEFGTMSYGKIGWLSFRANCRSGAVRTDAPKFIHSVDYSATMPKACLIDTIRAHSHNSNTPIARQTANQVRSSSENPRRLPFQRLPRGCIS